MNMLIDRVPTALCPQRLSLPPCRVPRQELLALGKPQLGPSLSVSPTHLQKRKVGLILPTREPSLAKE